MSRNHENVVWQDEAGRWSVGFYKRIPASNSYSDTYDSEWDDDFDFSTFEFASIGHLSQASAFAAWRGPNPGSSNVYTWSKANAKTIAELADMAKACNDPAYAAERQSKIENAKARKFRNELRDRLREKTITTAGQYRVQFSMNRRVIDAYGMSVAITGNLYQEGDWLLMKYTDNKNKTVVQKVWNTKTRSHGPKVLDIDPVRSSYSRW